jgi:hypothetical protein
MWVLPKDAKTQSKLALLLKASLVAGPGAAGFASVTKAAAALGGGGNSGYGTGGGGEGGGGGGGGEGGSAVVDLEGVASEKGDDHADEVVILDVGVSSLWSNLLS